MARNGLHLSPRWPTLLHRNNRPAGTGTVGIARLKQMELAAHTYATKQVRESAGSNAIDLSALGGATVASPGSIGQAPLSVYLRVRILLALVAIGWCVMLVVP
ncbi:MAG: hypothetical protein ING64_11560 [Rhodocyclaceae bacterium]|nr:hypothetical protein [Rhodocyclaceae bacterium]